MPSLAVRIRKNVRWALGLGRIRGWRRFAGAVEGRCGLEIGGPSDVFRRLGPIPVYDRVGGLDNSVFASSTVWSNHGEAYSFSRRRPPGRTFLLEASALLSIADASYDFVLSSHALEHVANPVKALREWKRVLRPRGALVLVLPDQRKTFDHRREPTPVAHMLKDAQDGVGEDDLTHLPEILERHDLSMDPAAGSREAFRLRSLANASNRCLHHHVFDERNAAELLSLVGFAIGALETAPPFHICFLAFSDPSPSTGAGARS